MISIVKYLDETLKTLDVKKKINLEKRHFVQMAQQKTIVKYLDETLETLDVKKKINLEKTIVDGGQIVDSFGY